jgi:FkbM family methyltransferase
MADIVNLTYEESMTSHFSEWYGRLAGRMSAYREEIAFGLSSVCTWTDQLSLLRYTMRFHIQNWLGHGYNNRMAFTIDLRIGLEKPISLTLRPFSGDLFVLYEVLARNVYYIAPTLLPPEKVNTIVDCGGNIGITSLFLAARYPHAKIISVEPHPENFALLQANVAQVPRITPICACVTGKPQSAVRFSTDQAAWGNRIATGDDGMLVPAITIDELCNQKGFAGIDLLKLDIEGAEEEVLENGTFLSRTEYIIIELHGRYGFQRFKHDIARSGLAAQQAHPPETYMVTAHRTNPDQAPARSS